MKSLLLSLMLFPLIGFTQTGKENTNDEYSSVRRTSWEPLLKGVMANFIVHVQCSRINSDLELGFKLMWARGAVDEGAVLQLTLDNDSTITLYNSQFTLPCIGCGAVGFFGSGSLGFYLRFNIPPRAANELAIRKIKKVRLEMHDTYIEDNVKSKSGDIIQKELRVL